VSRADNWGTMYHWNAGNLYPPTTLHVSRVTQYSVWLRAGRGSIPGRGERIFPLASVSRPALGPTQPPVQWVPGVLAPGVKRGRSVTLTTHPIYCPGLEWVGAVSPLPPSAFVVCSGTALASVISVHSVTAQGTDTGPIIAVRSSGVSQHSVQNMILSPCEPDRNFVSSAESEKVTCERLLLKSRLVDRLYSQHIFRLWLKALGYLFAGAADSRPACLLCCPWHRFISRSRSLVVVWCLD
jgi:hypothetical protein